MRQGWVRHCSIFIGKSIAPSMYTSTHTQHTCTQAARHNRQVTHTHTHTHTNAGAAPAPVRAAVSEPCTIDIDEKLSVHLNKEGGLENLEVQGTMSLVRSTMQLLVSCTTCVSGRDMCAALLLVRSTMQLSLLYLRCSYHSTITLRCIYHSTITLRSIITLQSLYDAVITLRSFYDAVITLRSLYDAVITRVLYVSPHSYASAYDQECCSCCSCVSLVPMCHGICSMCEWCVCVMCIHIFAGEECVATIYLLHYMFYILCMCGTTMTLVRSTMPGSENQSPTVFGRAQFDSPCNRKAVLLRSSFFPVHIYNTS
jgi:hypothetical protein